MPDVVAQAQDGRGLGGRSRTSLLPALGLLAVAAGFGLVAVHGTPEGGHAIGIWPTGVAVAALLVGRRPATPVMLALVGAIAFVTIRSGRPTAVAVGLGLGLVAETWVVWRIITGGVRRRPELYTIGDLTRYLAAAAAGHLVAAFAAVVTSLATGWGTPWLLGLTVGIASLASQLTVVPFFSRLRPHRGLARPLERACQWALLATLAPVVFAVDDLPSLTFLLFPVLAWGAMRSGAYEAIGQLFLTLGVAIAQTTRGRGPLAHIDERFDVPADAQGILLAAFVVVCALVVVPFVLSVGEEVEHARQVAAERDKVQSIVSGATGVAIIGTDEAGRITLFNPGAERLLGYRSAEVQGRLTRMLHTPAAVREKALELGVADDFWTVAAALIGRGPTVMKFRRKDGKERSHSMSLNRVVDDRGVVIGYVSTSEDVTERVAAERSLVASLEAEREAVERLRQVDQVKDAFVSSVSHELRTPITSMVGYVEMLQDGEYGALTREQLDAVQRVAANSNRLLSLIDDLLTLSRIQEDGLALVDRLLDLRAVVTAGCAVVAPAVERGAVVLDVDLPAEPVPFLGDRDMLERVVINFVGNAVKFTPAGGQVGVGLRVEGGEIALTVADTGIGIPHHEQERLFSRFFRSTLAQERAIPGSGLGLSIARAIIDQHGGRVELESEPGTGTTFRVLLPVIA